MIELDIIKEILNVKEKNNLVIAAAGSGKTELLTNILVEKIEKSIIDPLIQKIVIFTFTNNAADELIVRLSKKLGKKTNLLNAMYIGTIHGWCNLYLKENGFLSNTKVIDELERYQLLIRIYPFLNLASLYEEKNKFAKIKRFVKDLELFYHENLSIDDQIINSDLRRAIVSYLDFLKEQRLIDFGSLIRDSIFLLNNKKKDLKDLVVHLFIDEYQDVNPAQVKLFQTLIEANKHSSIFAVGDPRQAIYQWRGGDIGRILNFHKDFQDTNHTELTINYRSRTGIINFSNVIANDIEFVYDLKINDTEISEKRKDNQISVINIQDNNFNQEQIIINLIREMKSEGIDYSDIAILMRSVVNHSSDLMNHLNTLEIPYFSPNRNSGTIFIEEFMGSIFNLIELVSKGEPANKEEEDEISIKINKSLENINRYCNISKKSKIHVAIIEWYNEMVKNHRTQGKKIVFYKNEAYNFRRQFFDFCDKIEFTLNFQNKEIQMGFAAITQIMRAIEEIYRRRFHSFYSVRDEPISIFLKNLKWHIEYELERWAEEGADISDNSKLTIATVHAAKGLEWPVIIVPFMWDKRFPIKNVGHGTSFSDEIASRYGTNIDDEKRLWYVATTRARDRLFFLTGDINKNRKQSPFAYHEHIERLPCMINVNSLNEIENLSEVNSREVISNYYLSVSDLLLLVECPFQFYLRRISGISVPIGEEFGAGNIIHRVIERISNEDSSNFKEIIDEEVYLPLAELYFEINVKKSIVERIELLLEANELSNVDLTEIPFRMSISNVLVSGIIDATRKVQDKIEIIDWKNTIHKEFIQRYQNQILIYALGLKSLGVDVSQGIIYDLNKIETEDNKLIVNISEKEIENISKLLRERLDEFQKGKIEAYPNKKSCRLCDVYKICSKREKTLSD